MGVCSSKDGSAAQNKKKTKAFEGEAGNGIEKGTQNSTQKGTQKPQLSIQIDAIKNGDNDQVQSGGAVTPSMSLHTPCTSPKEDMATPREMIDDDDRKWEAYLSRQRVKEEELMALKENTPERSFKDLPKTVAYIRPFLSSTFRDFNNERNVLTKTTFPQVEKLCNDRGVFFAPLDLRWGVTSEQSGSGQVIKICLEEIDRCRPYFIGSLGFRNGWALSNDYVDDLLETTFQIGEAAFPWVKEMRDRSVTELEMLHGALNDPQVTHRALFYFRTVKYLEKLPKEERKTFADLGEVPEEKLHSLKTRIIQAGFKIKWFDAPEVMADQIEVDLRAMIDRDFPIENVDSVLDVELKDHQAFADMRTRVYVGGRKYFDALDNFLFSREGGQKSQLCIHGPSGCGKSSLVANWLKTIKVRRDAEQLPAVDVYNRSWKNLLVLERYIGATPGSSSPATLLRWIMDQIKSERDIDMDIPDNPKKLIDQFPEWLEAAAKQGPVLLVLDSISSIVGEENQTLAWLPRLLPPSVHLVCSAVTDTPTQKYICGQSWNMVPVTPLSDAECSELIHSFLGHYGKQIDKEQETMILACSRTRQPLYLVTFLQEVRVFGVYERVNERIGFYTEAKTVTELFTKVIERLEEDFNPNAPGLVEHVLSFIEMSRSGLNEGELKTALTITFQAHAGEDHVFPTVEFSALMLRLDQSLIDQRGLRAFSHNYMRDAVKKRYLRNSKHKSYMRQMLVKFWSQQKTSMRLAEELPYQLFELVKVNGRTSKSSTSLSSEMSTINYKEGEDLSVGSPVVNLAKCLSRLDLFKILRNDINKYDLHRYWGALESRGVDNVGVAYATSLQKYAVTNPPPLEFATTCEEIATFLIDTDRYKGADIYLVQALNFRRAHLPSHHEDIERTLNQHANLYYKVGKYAKALPLYKEALELNKQREGKDTKAGSILQTSIANILKEQGKFKECLPLYKASLSSLIVIAGKHNPMVAVSMSNLGELYLRLEQPDKAIALLQEALQIMEDAKGPNNPQVAIILSSLASCYMQKSQPGEALPLYERARNIKEKLLGKDHIGVAVVLNNLAALYHSTGQMERALKLYEHSLTIQEAAHGKTSHMVVPILKNLGGIYEAEDAFDISLSYFGRALDIVEKRSGVDNPNVCAILEKIALVHSRMEDHRAVVDDCQRIIAILIAHSGGRADHSRMLMRTYGRLGGALQSLDMYENALDCHKEELAIAEKTKNDEAIAATLVTIGAVQLTMGDSESAKESFTRAATLLEALFGADDERTVEANEWLLDCDEEALVDLSEDEFLSEEDGDE